MAGEYPGRYRPLIWRFLMKLPENISAYSDLGFSLIWSFFVEVILNLAYFKQLVECILLSWISTTNIRCNRDEFFIVCSQCAVSLRSGHRFSRRWCYSILVRYPVIMIASGAVSSVTGISFRCGFRARRIIRLGNCHDNHDVRKIAYALFDHYHSEFCRHRWWGHSWHVTHPNPPLHIIDCCDGLMKFHDPRLYQHFQSLKVSVGAIKS